LASSLAITVLKEHISSYGIIIINFLLFGIPCLGWL